MSVRDILQEQLIRHEGFSTKPYKDTVGKLTIGYGRNLDDNGISGSEALFLLQNDMDKAMQNAERLFEGFGRLDATRQAVLANMAFNMGRVKLALFVRLRRAIAEGDYKQAADEMLNSAWAKQVGKRATELAELMENG